VGGCDIVMEMYESGELAQTLGVEDALGETAEPVSAAAAPAGGLTQIENRLG
jgi:monothiol glutaredoxin